MHVYTESRLPIFYYEHNVILIKEKRNKNLKFWDVLQLFGHFR